MKKPKKITVSISKETEKQRKARHKNARCNMSKAQYKEYCERSRCTIGQGMHGDVFSSQKDMVHQRKANKRLCKAAMLGDY